MQKTQVFGDCLGIRQQICIVLALTALMVLLCFLKQEVVNSDAVRYIYCAQELKSGQWSQAFEHEMLAFYSALMLCVYKVTGDWILAGQLISMTAMVLAVLPFYLFVKDLMGKENAFISSLFFAVTPSFCENAVAIVRDPLFILFTACFLLALYRARSSRRYHAAAFLSALLAALTRMEGSLLLGIYALLAFWYGIRSKVTAIRKVAWGVGSGMAISLIAGFCCLRQDILGINRFNIFAQAVSFPGLFYRSFRANDARDHLHNLMEEMQSKGRGGALAEGARNHVLEIYLLLILQKTAECAFPTTFLLGVLGVYATFSRRDPNQRFLAAWLLFFAAIPYLFLLKEDLISRRYVMGVTMLLCCWTGSGFGFLWHRLHARFSLSRGWAIAFLIFLLLIPCAKTIRHRSGSEANIREAGLWLLEKAVRDRDVVTNDLRVLFYAGITFYSHRTDLVVKDADVPLLKERAREVGARFVVWVGKDSDLSEEPVIEFAGKKKTVFIYQVADQ